MAGVASRRSGDFRSLDGSLSKQESGEWCTSEQLDSGTPSTSLSSFPDNDDDGPRPFELYGKYTWKIHKFSKLNKKELRSKPFEVGACKWQILMYPQGCDVCNHLSLFLCVANHDELRPGWSHFAQFTIAVVNAKEDKNSKHSDTLHRFWKKEHDWGWKKFIDLSKIADGFTHSDTLTIVAQVQVIREKPNRPFRCLDCVYRRELVCVYLTNVEEICYRFIEEGRSKLVKFIEDKAKWSSFCAFWLRIDQKLRRSLTKEKTDVVLRVIVKQFLVEKEVTSTLVMDSLYSGLKTLEGQFKTKKDPRNLLGSSNRPVRVEQDMFVLNDDLLLLLERAAVDPLPPRDDKGPKNRTKASYVKDGSSGDDSSMGSHGRDERCLTELGRKTIERFVLSHIFSKIEVAYQEAVAFKMQEELIREEAAWLETEQKSKRGMAEKEKKSKKKQGKQKRNNHKGKDKNSLDRFQLENHDESKDSMADELKLELVKPDTFEDASDVSDAVDSVSEVLHPSSEEREPCLVNWDTDTSEVLSPTKANGGVTSALSVAQNGKGGINGSCTIDDTSYTCSSDSVPSVVMNGSYRANPVPYQDSHRSSTREWKQRVRAASNLSGCANEGNSRSTNARREVGPINGSYGSRRAESEPDTANESLLDEIKKVEQHVVKEQTISHQTGTSIKWQADTRIFPKEKTTVTPPSSISSSKYTPHPNPPKLEAKILITKPLSDGPQLARPVVNSAEVAVSSGLEPPKLLSSPKPTQKSLTQEVHVMSRPLSAPVVPGPKASTPVVSVVQSQPLMSCSLSVGPNPTSLAYQHQSYSTPMRGTNILSPPTPTSSVYSQPQSPNTSLNLLQHYPTPANRIYPPMFGTINRPSMQNDVFNPDLFKQVNSRSPEPLLTESPACRSNRQLTEEFPHLDIINDLLEDENVSTSVSPYLYRQFSYSGDNGMPNEVSVGTSTSPCNFERTHSYHEPVFQPGYTLGGSFESARDFFPQQNMRPFSNQWQVVSPDLSYLNVMTSEGGGYSYHIPDYSNLAVNSNGYTVFHPSNGQ